VEDQGQKQASEPKGAEGASARIRRALPSFGKRTRAQERRDEQYAEERRLDRAAIERCLNGDRDAFADLVDRYQRRAIQVAFGYVRSEEDAQDLVQDAFVKAYRSLERFELGSSFYAWFHRIVVNVCIDHHRKQKKRRSVEYDDGYARKDTSNERSLSADMRDAIPDRNVEAREMYEVVNEALSALSDKHREVIVLREVQQLSYEEISHATGAHLGTVMSRLHHARKKLQEALKPYYESIGEDVLASLAGEGVGTKRPTQQTKQGGQHE